MSLGRCGTWTLSVSKRGEDSPQQVPGATLKEGGEPAKQVRGDTDTLLFFALGLLGYHSGKGASAVVESEAHFCAYKAVTVIIDRVTSF